MSVKPIVVGFPRSGNNWLLYIASSLLGVKDPTSSEERKEVIDREHYATRGFKNNQKTIFCLRNFKECLVRHYSIETIREYGSVPQFLKMNHGDSGYRPHMFISNVQTYHNSSREKLLIYYEDLITDPPKEIQRLGEFLEIEQEKIDEFLDNLHEHEAKSIKAKKDCVTEGKYLKYHSTKLTVKEIKDFDNYYERFTNLYKRYLIQYQG